MDGPWEPAGPNWQAQRTALVEAITAAEIQADAPEDLAATWAGIIGIAVSRGRAGEPQVALENAVLRFVPAADGRGEGLGGIDVRVSDIGAVNDTAKARGLLDAHGRIAICGMRITVHRG
jgi:hypothetical protein